jgi:predicted methyltransferase MtxX (methanogen marker protein 4)
MNTTSQNTIFQNLVLIVGILFITAVVWKTYSCVSDTYKGQRWSCYQTKLTK